MKIETALTLEGRTKLIEDKDFPLKVKGYREVFCDAEGNLSHTVRQYIAEVQLNEDTFILTGESRLELTWKIGKILLAVLGEDWK